MKNRKWKQFDALAEKCEDNMIGLYGNNACWKEAYLTLKDIIKEGRKNNPDFPKKLYELDDATDFEHDIQSFLDDYFDTLSMYEKYETILDSADEMLQLFEWDESNIADIYFHKADALSLLNREKEAVEFCQAWLNEYPGNLSAATALIYAMVKQHNSDGTPLDAARKLVEKYIHPDTDCTDSNDILFMAASVLYETSGDKETHTQIENRIKEYEEKLDELITDYETEDDWLTF